MRVFSLPSLGADMDKGTLIEWRVRPGDVVKRGQVVALVDTTKAAIEVECWEEGTVDELLVEPDAEMPVGTPMIYLREANETAEQAEQWKAKQRAGITSVREVMPEAAPVAAAEVPGAVAIAPSARHRVSPAARRHAAEKGIDVDRIAGTGPQGAVTVEDVDRAAAGKPPTPGAAAPDRAAQVRQTIASSMARSKREIPHYYLATDVPLMAATAWLAAQNEKRPITERLLMAVLFVKAVAKALEKFPDLNGFYRDGRYQPSSAIHIGVAISVRQGGLIAPALLDANTKPLAQLMKELNDLVLRARAFSLKSSEISQPTVTLTNLGENSPEAVYPVIYPPQVAIVGFGGVSERAWVVNGAVQVSPVVTASLAADHRVSDGHRGALFLNEVKGRLQTPGAL